MRKVSDKDVVINAKFEDVQRVSNLINAWRKASLELPKEEQTVRIMFMACLQIIKTCGPAYCRIAIKTLEMNP